MSSDALMNTLKQLIVPSFTRPFNLVLQQPNNNPTNKLASPAATNTATVVGATALPS